MKSISFGYFIYVLIVITSLGGCTVLSDPQHRPPSFSLSPAHSGLLADVTESFAGISGDKESGFLLINKNDEALRWRLALVDHAVRSIDIQYFIWENDESGNLLLDRLLKAARRGVRVRLLVDDFGLNADSKALALLSRHPNFELKIYNPNYVRDNLLGKLFEFALDMDLLNQRMHNKLFVVDGNVAILGGRNIGNPYFGLSRTYNFRDLDVLVVGEVLSDLGDAFDEYWNSEEVYPAYSMEHLVPESQREELGEEITAYLKKKSNKLVNFPLAPEDWSEMINTLLPRLHIGYADYIQDKAHRHNNTEKLVDQIDFTPYEIHRELLISTPYLIPDEGLYNVFKELSDRGITIKIITNSLGSNNHTIVHSHYRKYRNDILLSGVKLYEFRHDPSTSLRKIADVDPIESDFVSLHAKIIAADEKICFIGSLNLDPRSMKINTENGMIIVSEKFVSELSQLIEEMLSPDNSWEVLRNKDGEIFWQGDGTILKKQPARNAGQRVKDFFYQFIPVEDQL